MRKIPVLLRSAKFVHGVHLAVIAGAIVVVPLTTAQTVHVIKAHAHAKVVTVPHIAAAPAKPPIKHAVTKPSTPAPQPVSAPAPAPAPNPTPPPQPVVHASPAPATVAATGAAPGSGVHTLTPAPSSSTSSSASTTSTSSSTTTSSSSNTSSGGTTTTSSGPTALTNPDYTSYNWAGYMASSASYTGVSASWVVPNPTGDGSSTTADAAWVGIGGVSTNDLIQVGSEDTVSASGTVSAAVFYELLPASPIYPAAISISPGDSLTASLSEQGPGSWLVTISDTTDGQTFSTTVSYTSSHSSAEWIEEDPSYTSGQLVPFDNFGIVNFTSGHAIVNGVSQTISASNGASIALVNQSGTTLAGPSARGSGGASFSVIRNP